MDRIGAIKEAMRLQNRLVSLSAPISFWQKERFYVLLILLFSLLWFTLGQADAANLTAWLPVCTDYVNGVCNAQSWQQLTIPDVVPVDSYAANQTILGWYVANQFAVQNTLNNQSTLLAQAFDPVTAGQFFVWGFTIVILLGVAAYGIGQVLKMTNDIFR
jgi:hypothetical protein